MEDADHLKMSCLPISSTADVVFETALPVWCALVFSTATFPAVITHKCFHKPPEEYPRPVSVDGEGSALPRLYSVHLQCSRAERRLLPKCTGGRDIDFDIQITFPHKHSQPFFAHIYNNNNSKSMVTLKARYNSKTSSKYIYAEQPRDKQCHPSTCMKVCLT